MATAAVAALGVPRIGSAQPCCLPEVTARTTWPAAPAAQYDRVYSLTSDDLGGVYAVLQRNLRPGLFRSLDDGRTWDDSNGNDGDDHIICNGNDERDYDD